MCLRVLCLALLASSVLSLSAFASSDSKVSVGQRWYGTYVCGQTVFPATLEITSLSATDSTQFEVGARLLLNLDGREASYGLKGTLRRDTDALSLTPASPGLGPAFRPDGVSGNISRDGTSFRGDVTHGRCTALTLQAGASGPLPKVFGIELGTRIEVPTCPIEVRADKRCTPSGLSCWTEQTRVETRSQTCQSPADGNIYFARSDQPGWVDGGLKPILLGRELIGFEFKAKGKDVALDALTTRFGASTSREGVTKARDAIANCVNGNCVVTPAMSWVEYRYTWEREGMIVTLFEGVVTVRTAGSAMRQQAVDERKRVEDRKQERSGRTF